MALSLGPQPLMGHQRAIDATAEAEAEAPDVRPWEPMGVEMMIVDTDEVLVEVEAEEGTDAVEVVAVHVLLLRAVALQWQELQELTLFPLALAPQCPIPHRAHPTLVSLGPRLVDR